MGDYKLQYESVTESCQVCWDEKNKFWVKVIIQKIEKLPKDVEEQIEKDKERAALLNEATKN